MSKNNDDNLILIILLAVGGLIAYAVWQFATTFGLDRGLNHKPPKFPLIGLTINRQAV